MWDIYPCETYEGIIMFFSNTKAINLFLLLLVFMSGLVSVYDNVLNYVTMDTLESVEKNPVASWIISKVGVGGFIEVKAIGTIIAVIIMCGLVFTKWKWTIVPVFLFQFILFFYLTCWVEFGFWNWKDMFAPLKMVIDFYKGHI